MDQFNEPDKDYELEFIDQMKTYVKEARKDGQSWKDIYWAVSSCMIGPVMYDVEMDELDEKDRDKYYVKFTVPSPDFIDTRKLDTYAVCDSIDEAIFQEKQCRLKKGDGVLTIIKIGSDDEEDEE